MAVTLQDIADAAGVDKATASRVLSGKALEARISQERIDRVLKVAGRLRFRKNVAAQSINTGRLGVVELVLSRGNDTSTTPIKEQLGIHDALAKHDMRMQMSWLSDTQFTDEAFLPAMLREHRSDGLLLNYTHRVPPRFMELVKHYQLPSIWINSVHQHDCIYPDDAQGSELVTQHLINSGRKRIIYTDFAHDFSHPDGVHYSAVDRREGYRRAMAQGGLEAKELYRPKSDDWIPEIRDQLKRRGRPDAIVSYGYEVEVIIAECLRQGIHIPDDLAIATFNDTPRRIAGQPTLTVVLPTYDLGINAAEMLIDKIAQPKTKLPPRKILCTLHLANEAF